MKLGVARTRRARFRIYGELNRAPGGTLTVTVLGATGIVEVRPLRRRRVYTRTLEQVARMILESCVKQEIRERKAARRQARR